MLFIQMGFSTTAEDTKSECDNTYGPKENRLPLRRKLACISPVISPPAKLNELNLIISLAFKKKNKKNCQHYFSVGFK